MKFTHVSILMLIAGMLFLTPQKVAEIKQAVQTKDSDHGESFGALKSWVDTKGRQPHDPASKNWNYDRAYMAITYGPGGLSQEGIGYTGYGGIYLLEACYALAETGDDTLVKQLSKHAFWKLQMFTGSSLVTDEFRRRYLQQGVSGTAINDEGWASLTVRSAPDDQLPHFGWFYDRHMGRFAPGTPSQKYDNQRAAWVWAIICYPPDLQTKDPAAMIGHTHFDEKVGGFFFRNRWKDENDILCSIYSDLANHKAWDKREATGIRLLAHGTPFFGGPGKSSGAGLHSRLLIDGKANAGKDSGKNGQNVVAESNDHGGYVVVGGGSTQEPERR